MQFAAWILEKCSEDNNFLRNMLFTDEAQFTRDGVLNYHNEHKWAFTNPHAIKQNRNQYQFNINVWAGIVGEQLLGPYFFSGSLSGHRYLEFLQNYLPDLLEDVPLEIMRRMWFVHDGAPAHFQLNVRQFLDTEYSERWIGRGAPAPRSWPPRSPDCNPIDFYLWGHVKTLVYQNVVPQSLDELIERIIEALIL